MLDASVLVINRLWQAVNICSARRAVCLLYCGHAQVVIAEDGTYNTFNFEDWKDFSQQEGSDGEWIFTISSRIRIPQIIALLWYDRIPYHEVKFTRRNIYARDGNRCQYCGKKFDTRDLNLDHVIPIARGGLTTWENIVCSCILCNTRKGNRTLREVRMKLIRKPRKPNWQSFLTIGHRNIKYDSWRHFLDVAYWNVELGE